MQGEILQGQICSVIELLFEVAHCLHHLHKCYVVFHNKNEIYSLLSQPPELLELQVCITVTHCHLYS